MVGWLVVALVACGNAPVAGKPVDAPAPSTPTAEQATVAAEPYDEAPPEVEKPAPSPAPPTSPVALPDHLPSPAEVAYDPKGLHNGQFVADFSGPSLSASGGTFALSSAVSPKGDGKAKVAIVAFMASWCGYCRESLPTLKQLVDDHGKDLQIVVLTTDDTVAKQQVEAKHVADAGLDVPVLASNAELQRAYMGDRNSLPHFYVTNRLGEVLVQDTGFGDKVRPLMPRQVMLGINHPDYMPR